MVVKIIKIEIKIIMSFIDVLEIILNDSFTKFNFFGLDLNC